MRDPFAKLLGLVDRHGRAAMVSLVTVSGSAPREAGSRMVVAPDGSFSGTIGGGALEWQAIALAQAALGRADGPPFQVRSLALGPELGQCCGGRVDIAVEVVAAAGREALVRLVEHEQQGSFATTGRVAEDGRLTRVVDPIPDDLPPGGARWQDGLLVERFGEPLRPVLLFGAGHVGRSLALVLAPLPFQVTWIDSRPSAFPAAMPGNVRCLRLDDPASAVATAPAGAFVLVMTHSHALDLEVVTAALSASRFPYVGLIGSATKRARFERQLAAAGIDRSIIDTLVCPIGVAGISGKAPAMIAAATVAELLICDQNTKLATGEGGAVAAPNMVGVGGD